MLKKHCHLHVEHCIGNGIQLHETKECAWIGMFILRQILISFMRLRNVEEGSLVSCQH